MAKLTVDFTKEVGKIKPMHAVGQPPIWGISDTFFHYLDDAHIPYSRLHDIGGLYGGNMYVDIPNIFRDFDADENDPAAYDFAFTDILIKDLFKHGCEPIYRLGVTIENYQMIKAYRISPPKDFDKWARICEHIIKHYNCGWADGFHYGIKYWEIWNEPENGYENSNNQMWHGTEEQYFELYRAASKHLKKVFGDSIKVGGFASCGFYALFSKECKEYWEKPREDRNIPEDAPFWIKANIFRMDYFEDFLKYIKENDCPLDFFSYHSYASVEETHMMTEHAYKMLEKYGYGNVETQINEWNNAFLPDQRGTSFASANAAAMMIDQQNLKTDILCYYDARVKSSDYAGLFNCDTFMPRCTYYSLFAFGELYALGTQTYSVCDRDGVYALCAKNKDKFACLITNIKDTTELETNLPDGMTAYLIDGFNHLTKSNINIKKIYFEKDKTYLIKNY